MLVSHPNPLYSPPQGKIRKRFIRLQVRDLKKVPVREYNSERALILAIATLQKEPGISWVKEIKKKTTQRIDPWEAGKLQNLSTMWNIQRREASGRLEGKMTTTQSRGNTTRW